MNKSDILGGAGFKISYEVFKSFERLLRKLFFCRRNKVFQWDFKTRCNFIQSLNSWNGSASFNFPNAIYA